MPGNILALISNLLSCYYNSLCPCSILYVWEVVTHFYIVIYEYLLVFWIAHQFTFEKAQFFVKKMLPEPNNWTRGKIYAQKNIYCMSKKFRPILYIKLLLGASEITANLYRNCVHLYWEGYVNCRIYLRLYMELPVNEMGQNDLDIQDIFIAVLRVRLRFRVQMTRSRALIRFSRKIGSGPSFTSWSEKNT